MKNIIDFLKKKKLINQITNEENISSIVNKKKINLYCGFDITSNSLHIGHIIPLICLKYFKDFGHEPIILIGSATSLIGDPSFRKKKRKLNNLKKIKKWKKNIINQIKNFLNYKNIKFIDNYNWYKKINIINFLYKIGNYFQLNKIINKKIIKKNIKNKNINFSEFFYIILQSYDFLILNKKYNVKLQIGGSDQWGNIISGIYLIKKINKKKTFGLTFPLITKKNGIKFGKTEKKNIWLDKKKTNYYKFYQYLINISNQEANKFLNFIKIKEKNKNKSNQYIIANKLTKIIHGKKGLKIAKEITKMLFNFSFKKINIKKIIKYGLPLKKIKSQKDLQSILVKSKIVSSRNKAYKMIKNNAIKINGKIINNIKYDINETKKILNKFILIKRGKKKHCLIYLKN